MLEQLSIINNNFNNLCEHELSDVKQSATWLTGRNIKPRDEASYCFLQNINIFFGKTAICPHFRAASRTVDHLATKCDRMLGHDYNTLIWLNAYILPYAINLD